MTKLIFQSLTQEKSWKFSWSNSKHLKKSLWVKKSHKKKKTRQPKVQIPWLLAFYVFPTYNVWNLVNLKQLCLFNTSLLSLVQYLYHISILIIKHNSVLFFLHNGRFESEFLKSESSKHFHDLKILRKFVSLLLLTPQKWKGSNWDLNTKIYKSSPINKNKNYKKGNDNKDLVMRWNLPA